MVDESVVGSVRRYLASLPAYGIHPSRAIMFGSYATGREDKDSDIDLIVIEFDVSREREVTRKLWRVALLDSRIEPIACGEREWEHNDSRLILEIAWREGVVIHAR